MHKVAQMLLAGLLVAGLAGCNRIKTTNAGNVATIEVTGTYSEQDAASLTVGGGEALVIDPTIHEGSFVVEVSCNGRDVFFDDVATYDDRIYVPDSQGRCDVAVYTEGTKGKVRLSVIDKDDVRDNQRKSEAGEASQVHEGFDATTLSLDSEYRRGTCDEYGYSNDVLGVYYPWVGNYHYQSEESLQQEDTDGYKMDMYAENDEGEVVWVAVYEKDLFQNALGSFDDPGLAAALEDFEHETLVKANGQGVVAAAQAASEGGKDIIVASSWDWETEHWCRQQRFFPSGRYVVRVACVSHDMQRAAELLTNLLVY